MANQADDYTKQLQAELAAAKQEAADALVAKEQAEKEAADALAALKTSGGPVPIKGKYKGYGFPAGHTRIRNKQGIVCDTQSVLDAANNKESADHAAAVEILDHLIKIGYGYLVKQG